MTPKTYQPQPLPQHASLAQGREHPKPYLDASPTGLESLLALCEDRDEETMLANVLDAVHELPPALSNVLAYVQGVDREPETDARLRLLSYTDEGDHWKAEYDGVSLNVPKSIMAASPAVTAFGSNEVLGNCPSYPWLRNVWTWSHKAFLRLLSDVASAKAEMADPGEEIVIRYCVNCGRSACPYGGPYAYIRGRTY